MKTLQEQNAIAISLLNHLLSDNASKAVIHKFGSKFANDILNPLIQTLEQVDSLEALDETSKHTIDHLMLHHSNKGRQYDGLKMESSWESLNNKEGALSVLSQMRELLSDITKCNTIHSLANYFKSMYDISAAFVQNLSEGENENFNQLTSIIMPTPAEYGSRISFTEVGNRQKKYATTFGLFTMPRDLIEETKLSEETPVAEARITGKSLFKKISTQERYRITFINYLRAKNEHENHTDKSSSEERDNAENHLNKQIEKMINLDIPLDFTANDTEKVSKIALANETWIEKEAKRCRNECPLIAGISGSTGRLLITLIHFKLIQANEESINELQVLTNFVAAHIAFQGHHSFDEVYEASRRAIDAMLITNADTANQEDINKIIEHPLYKVGINFLHPYYAEKVIEDSKQHLENGAEMPFKY